MKKFGKEFLLRGLMTAAGGPVVLAIIYGILGAAGVVESLSPGQVCAGILTITLMAFFAAGITAVYTAEQLPLISAILIHAGVLYLDYLMIYLFNDWIPKNMTAIGIFTGIFAAGFALIWVCIYLFTRSRTDTLNKKMHSN